MRLNARTKIYYIAFVSYVIWQNAKQFSFTFITVNLTKMLINI